MRTERSQDVIAFHLFRRRREWRELREWQTKRNQFRDSQKVLALFDIHATINRLISLTRVVTDDVYYALEARRYDKDQSLDQSERPVSILETPAIAMSEFAHAMSRCCNLFAKLQRMNRNYSHWDVFAASAAECKKVMHCRGSSAHEAWFNAMEGSIRIGFGLHLWAGNVIEHPSRLDELADLDKVKRSKVEQMLRESAKEEAALYLQEGPTSESSPDVLFQHLYGQWCAFAMNVPSHSWYFRRAAELNGEFLRAVSLQRDREASAPTLISSPSNLSQFVTSAPSPKQTSSKAYIYELATKTQKSGGRLSWKAIAVKFNRKYGEQISPNAVRIAATRYATQQNLPLPTRQKGRPKKRT